MNPTSSFGERLKAEREARGIRLSAIADATKISKTCLLALENNEFDSLPGGVFNRGFVRAYAEHLGLDPDLTLQQFEAETRVQAALREGAGDSSPELPAPALSLPQRFSTRNATALTVLLIVVASVMIAIWFSRSRPVTATGPPTALPARPDQAVPYASQPDSETAKIQPAPAAIPDQPLLSPPPQDSERAKVEPAPPGRLKEEAPSLPPRGPENVEPEPDSTIAAVAPALPKGRAPSEDAPPANPAPANGDEENSQKTRASGLSVPDSGTGSAVIARQLEGRSSSFTVGDKVWFWTLVSGGTPGLIVRHVWLHEGRMVSSVEITLGGPHWRAHSYQTLTADAAGEWVVELRDDRDVTLARETFNCSRPTKDSVQGLMTSPTVP
jgi:cytoskeletal protein RodZ